MGEIWNHAWGPCKEDELDFQLGLRFHNLESQAVHAGVCSSSLMLQSSHAGVSSGLGRVAPLGLCVFGHHSSPG